MRLKGVYIATATAEAIASAAKQQMSVRKLSKTCDVVNLEVRDLQNKTTPTLHVTFLSLKKDGLLHGRTDNDEHVFIKLGNAAERGGCYPSVILSVSEPHHIGIQSPASLNNGNPNRR